jgi:N-acetylglutamate synthase-like GNAT family acetyltransferase
MCTEEVPSLFLNIGFSGIDLDDVPEEIRKSELFKGDCPMVVAYMMKRTI